MPNSERTARALVGCASCWPLAMLPVSKVFCIVSVHIIFFSLHLSYFGEERRAMEWLFCMMDNRSYDASDDGEKRRKAENKDFKI
jgi:hypothetical protein